MIIPAYKTKKSIINVVSDIPKLVDYIVVVDDACPEGTGNILSNSFHGKRCKILFHSENLGVGGAMISGYRYCSQIDVDILVKMDSDGQMDSSQITTLLDPIIDNRADYVKGNRFADIEKLRLMPKSRIFGNLVLSFMSKLSTGYWSIFDPNNGYTAISSECVQKLPLNKIDKRYFFESDMLFRLNMNRARVLDVYLPALYADEISNLNIGKSIFEFSIKHFRNFLKRIAYCYFILDFGLASIELVLGNLLLMGGVIYGLVNFINNIKSNSTALPGTTSIVMLSIILGTQLILNFLSYDIGRERKPS